MRISLFSEVVITYRGRFGLCLYDEIQGHRGHIGDVIAKISATPRILLRASRSASIREQTNSIKKTERAKEFSCTGS